MDKLFNLIFKITERFMMLFITLLTALLTAVGRLLVNLIAHWQSQRRIRHHTSVNRMHRTKQRKVVKSGSIHPLTYRSPDQHKREAKRKRQKQRNRRH